MPADGCRGRSINVLPFALTLSDIYSQHVVLLLLYVFIERRLALPLERQKSDHWLCIAKNKEGSVPPLGVWHFMKWCFLRSLHWACLPGRRKAVSVCKPGGCNSCLAMLRSQLSSKASVSPTVLGPLTQGERLDCSSHSKWAGCRSSHSKAPVSSRWAEWLFLTGATVGPWHYLQNNIC